MKYRFCPICGSYLNTKDKSSLPSCPSGHYTVQSQLGVEVAPIIARKGAIVLERNKEGGWNLPTATVQASASPVHTIRELTQSIVLCEVNVGALVNLRSTKNACTLFYEAEPENTGTLAIAHQWFSIDSIPWNNITNNVHREVLVTWVQQHVSKTRTLVSVS